MALICGIGGASLASGISGWHQLSALLSSLWLNASEENNENIIGGMAIRKYAKSWQPANGEMANGNERK